MLPNPFTSKLVIDLSDDELLGHTGRVYSLDGQFVHKFRMKKNSFINTENRNGGFYILNIAGGNIKIMKI